MQGIFSWRNFMENSQKTDGTTSVVVPALLNRKEMAHYCKVSLATLDRGIRDGIWPFSAFTRLSPGRIVYPASIFYEIERKALAKKGGEI
jgi:hypothetical protein